MNRAGRSRRCWIAQCGGWWSSTPKGLPVAMSACRRSLETSARVASACDVGFDREDDRPWRMPGHLPPTTSSREHRPWSTCRGIVGLTSRTTSRQVDPRRSRQRSIGDLVTAAGPIALEGQQLVLVVDRRPLMPIASEAGQASSSVSSRPVRGIVSLMGSFADAMPAAGSKRRSCGRGDRCP